MGWGADCPDPDNFLRVGFPWVLTGWEDQNYEALLQAAKGSRNQLERMDLYKQAEEILSKAAPIFPVGYSYAHLLIKPWLTRCTFIFGDHISFKDIVMMPH